MSFISASPDHWNESVHTWSGPTGGGSGLEYKVGKAHSHFRAVSLFSSEFCPLWSLWSQSKSPVRVQPITSSLHCSLCSYEGDVDIDAVVKEPITAGVKGLKVGVSSFFIFCLPLIMINIICVHCSCKKLSWIFQLKGMLRVILEPLIGDAPLVGGITFFFIRRPVSAYRHFIYCHQLSCAQISI